MQTHTSPARSEDPASSDETLRPWARRVDAVEPTTTAKIAHIKRFSKWSLYGRKLRYATNIASERTKLNPSTIHEESPEEATETTANKNFEVRAKSSIRPWATAIGNVFKSVPLGKRVAEAMRKRRTFIDRITIDRKAIATCSIFQQTMPDHVAGCEIVSTVQINGESNDVIMVTGNAMTPLRIKKRKALIRQLACFPPVAARVIRTYTIRE